MRSTASVGSLLTLAVVAGCGAAAAPESEHGAGEPGGGGDRGGDEHSARDEPQRCAGSCSEGDVCPASSIDWRCECVHHADQICGGAWRPLGPGTWSWTCTPIDPRTDRGDGCPFARPAAGAACDAARTCRYTTDGCGYHGVAATCTGGAWAVDEYDVPPPP